MTATALLLSILLFTITIASLLDYLENNLLKYIISGVLSATLISVLFTLSLFMHLPYIYFLGEIICLDVIALFLLGKRRFSSLKLATPIDKSLLLFSFLILVGSLLFWNKVKPWGEWDAWTIWNLHAKFLVQDSYWTNLFTKAMEWSHPDYPLLLPSLIAAIWKGTGTLNPVVPAIIAYFVFLCLCGLIYTSLGNNRLKITGLLGVLLLILDSRFISQTSSQYADSFVALFFLISILLQVRKKLLSHRELILAGLFSCLPIWVKNEGNVFFLLSSIVILLQYRKDKLAVLYYLAGALPIIVITVYFKLNYAPANDITSALNGGIRVKIFNLDRYLTILKFFANTILFQFPLLLILPFSAFILKAGANFSRINFILISTLIAYLSVYIITPIDLLWHLNTSLSRLLHQLYPSVIFSCLWIIERHFARESKEMELDGDLTALEPESLP